jgi:hypothetical protein
MRAAEQFTVCKPREAQRYWFGSAFVQTFACTECGLPIAAAWKQTRSMERTGAGASSREEHPKRKSVTQRPLPHGA